MGLPEDRVPACGYGEHPSHDRGTPPAGSAALERAARIFRAAGDVARLRLLDELRDGERCVTELADVVGAGLSTVSQQLRILRSEDLVVTRREGKHIYYSLSDQHIIGLLDNVLEHACEPESRPDWRRPMSQCDIHGNHEHKHGAGCGHTGIQHDGHTDYLHDGHLHHVHGDHVDEHRLEVGGANPGDCTPNHNCGAHEQGHRHGPGCGHEAVPHGDHTDYLVEGHLHHPHGDHCDDHGRITVAA
jgi:DNA-binding transcriptional ArsR family regulator